MLDGIIWHRLLFSHIYIRCRTLIKLDCKQKSHLNMLIRSKNIHTKFVGYHFEATQKLNELAKS